MTPASLLARARSAIATAAGIHGLRSVALSFDGLDPRGSGVLPVVGVRFALAAHGVTLTDAEYSLMLSPFIDGGSSKGLGGSAAAASGGGFVKRAAIFSALRGGLDSSSLPPHVADAVAAAYSALCARAQGPPTIGALKIAIDGKWDPRARAGTVTRAEAKADFGRQWPTHPRPSDVVTAAHFEAYYADVVACLPADTDVATLIYNTWHTPNAGSWVVKKNKRVLVTFHKGEPSCDVACFYVRV